MVEALDWTGSKAEAECVLLCTMWPSLPGLAWPGLASTIGTKKGRELFKYYHDSLNDTYIFSSTTMTSQLNLTFEPGHGMVVSIHSPSLLCQFCSDQFLASCPLGKMHQDSSIAARLWAQDLKKTQKLFFPDSGSQAPGIGAGMFPGTLKAPGSQFWRGNLNVNV